MVAVLAPHHAVGALLGHMLLYVPPLHQLTALAWAFDSFVTAPLGRVEMRLDVAEVTGPLAATLVVRTVDLERTDALLKVPVSKVVKVDGMAVGAGFTLDPLLNAALAVVLTTADDLAWIAEDL